MSAPEDRLAHARREAEDARQRLAGTLGAVQSQLRPDRLIDDAIGGLRNRAGRGADEIAQFVRARPVSVAAVAGSILLFILRRPIAAAIERMTDEATADGDTAFNDPSGAIRTETGGFQ